MFVRPRSLLFILICFLKQNKNELKTVECGISPQEFNVTTTRLTTTRQRLKTKDSCILFSCLFFFFFFFFFLNWHYTSFLHTMACDFISRVAPGRPAPPSYVSSRFASILCTTCLSEASTLTRPLRSDHHAVIITLIGCALGNCVRRSGTVSSPSTVFS